MISEGEVEPRLELYSALSTRMLKNMLSQIREWQRSLQLDLFKKSGHRRGPKPEDLEIIEILIRIILVGRDELDKEER